MGHQHQASPKQRIHEMEEKMISQFPLLVKIGAIFLCLVMGITTVTTVALIVAIVASGGLQRALEIVTRLFSN
jgi:hypothetical protein